MSYVSKNYEEYLKIGNRLIDILQIFWDEKASGKTLTGPMYRTEETKNVLIRYFSTLEYPEKSEVEVGHLKIKLETPPPEKAILRHVESMAFIYNVDVKKFSSFLTLPRSGDKVDRLSKLKEEAIQLYTKVRDIISKHYEKSNKKDRDIFDKYAKVDISAMYKLDTKKRKVEK